MGLVDAAADPTATPFDIETSLAAPPAAAAAGGNGVGSAPASLRSSSRGSAASDLSEASAQRWPPGPLPGSPSAAQAIDLLRQSLDEADSG